MWWLLLLTTGSLILTCVSGQSSCPANYTLNGESCLMISAAQGTWAEAMRTCKMDGGSLVSVTDPTIQSFIANQITSTNFHNNITFHTNNDYVYHYMHDSGVSINGKYSIIFYVKACHDAHIALSSVKGLDTQETYEIVIGGWSDSQSVIRDCKQCPHKDEVRHSSHPISCSEFHPFWISWANSYIRVGTGSDVGRFEFMSWNDTDPHAVNYVAFGTGFGSSGDWIIPMDTYMPGKFWVGASDLVDENEWLWLPSQTTLDEYSNWAPGEPDNAKGSQHCMLLDMRTNNMWHDEECEEKRNFICQKQLFDSSIVG